MGVNKLGLFVFFVLGVSLSIGFISADTCSIKASCDPLEFGLMGLSDTSNAHGELESESSYSYSLCCDFGDGDNTCDGSNKVVGLSSSTNAHGEVPGNTNYDSQYDVCYENLICTNSDDSCPGEYPIEMISLSSSTNAHMGNFNAYSTKICCKQSILQRAYFADMNRNIITKPINAIPGTTEILLILKNSGLSPGENVDFEIYEDDGILGNDDIRTGAEAITGTIDANLSGSESWVITAEDIDSGGFELDDVYEFFFKVNGKTSENILNITTLSEVYCLGIGRCSDYQNQSECENDINTCGVAEETVETNEGGGFVCGQITTGLGGCDIWSNCECAWDSDEGVCMGERVDVIDEPCSDTGGTPSKIGSCSYNENTTDDCADGFLMYSWNASYSWDLNNFNTTSVSGPLWVLGDDGLWHYDPDGKAAACDDGSNSVPCPAQVELPFFGYTNFIITIIVIALLYIAINSKIKKRTKKRRH